MEIFILALKLARDLSLCVHSSELGPLNLPACEFLHVVRISYFPF